MIKTLGTGFNDFYYGKGVKGKVLGTGSMIKNTVEGSLGSVEALTGSLSKGILLMSYD